MSVAASFGLTFRIYIYSHCPSKKADKATSPRQRRREVAVDFQGEILYQATLVLLLQILGLGQLCVRKSYSHQL